MIKKILNFLFGSKDDSTTQSSSSTSNASSAPGGNVNHPKRKNGPEVPRLKKFQSSGNVSHTEPEAPTPKSSRTPQPAPASNVDEELAWKLENMTPKMLFEDAYEAWKANKYAASFPIFKALADQGHPDACSYAGMAYELGEGVTKNVMLMEQYYRQGIAAHHYVSVYRYAPYLLQHGRAEEARQLYEQSIQEGWATGDAYYKLGVMYETGRGGDKDLQKAIQYYQQAKKKKNSDAARALQRLNVPEEDNNSTFNVGLPESALKLSPAELFAQGKEAIFGPEPDPPLAIAYLQLAASKDHALAMNLLARFYGNPKMPIHNESLAQKFSRMATLKMVREVEEDHSLAWDAGYAYHHGAGCMKDLASAMQCLRIGAADGNPSCMWELGQIALETNRPEDAFTLFLQAAELGLGPAMYDLAQCYEKGRGTDKDVDTAIDWYEQCVETGCTVAKKAQNRLNHLKN